VVAPLRTVPSSTSTADTKNVSPIFTRPCVWNVWKFIVTDCTGVHEAFLPRRRNSVVVSLSRDFVARAVSPPSDSVT